MLTYLLDKELAQEIVSRTMRIIGGNVNVMDSAGRIIGSSDRARIGTIHEGALLAIMQRRLVDIDGGMAKYLQGVNPGVNLPLRMDDNIVGVIGLTGNPTQLRQYGELVCMTAEMMLEQTRLLHMLTHHQRIREKLVLELIHAEESLPETGKWARQLGIDVDKPRVAILIEVDNGRLDDVMNELQQSTVLLNTQERENLIAIVSLTEIVVLHPALNLQGVWDPEEHHHRLNKLFSHMMEDNGLNVRIAFGNYFSGPGGIARSWHIACITMRVGKQHKPSNRCYFYSDLMLPVLLNSLQGDWQVKELVLPLSKLKTQDSRGLLMRTLKEWFKNNVHPTLTANALYVHRNTLDYRLNRISEISGLNLDNFDERLLMYIALQLDQDDCPIDMSPSRDVGK
ncbi:sugar diacid recognition domain-containing protein (plasmid) [Klebsiella sp. WOUb02]|uniref:sugar diacid recognition domain-containing protein n=1 Tax=Klebsiella sp. WOUb02 TaxID=3161071 RepID=UPI003CE74D1B